MRRLHATQRRLLTTAMSTKESVMPFMEPMHVLGSGSIGLLFASSIRMAFPSYPLTMLLRPPHEPRLQSLAGNNNSKKRHMEVCLLRAGRPSMVYLPAEIIGSDSRRAIRNLMLATKAPDAARAVISVLDRLDSADGARIIILCNGALAVQEELSEVLQKSSLSHPDKVQLHLASTTHGAFRDFDENQNEDDELYHVVHAGIGKTYVQEFSSLARLWDQSGLVAESMSQHDMSVLLWHKLAANCVINPLTALLQCENGQLLEESMYREFKEPILQELATVAQHICQQVDQQLSLAELQSFVHNVISNTAHNKSSMLQDVMRKKPTEIQYLNGYVVRKGRELGLDVSANQELCSRVEDLTAGQQLSDQ